MICISNLCAWAPGVVTPDEWKAWEKGERDILLTKDAPKLEYTDMLFRRRLSQVSKMTVQVVHDVLEQDANAKNYKQVFISFRGELQREFQVSKMLVEEHAILPANFSLSVFNTPIALATIALDLHAGYTAIYPAKENFNSAFQGAASSILCANEKSPDQKIILVYADELIPEEYNSVEKRACTPFAFACILSKAGTLENTSRKVFTIEDVSKVPNTAIDFLKMIISGGAL
ncbi:MAG: beta-ketoacyl synthase chain length factor [Treponema sp.]|nr:beta-ketoacyl synthase chain length factor [Treponema sp.]